MKLFDFPPSGNGYKVRLLLSHLARPYRSIPVLELDDGTFLAESNAILHWLAQVLQWMFFEQYSHEPAIATARFWLSIRGTPLPPFETDLLRQKCALGHAALQVMEGHLSRRGFVVEERYGIADIALYAYTHVAGEGGFDLGAYPAIREWLARVRSQPGHITIHTWTPLAWTRSPGIPHAATPRR